MSYVVSSQTLPLSMDVSITVSSSQSALATDLSVPCFVDSGLGFMPNANRVRFYLTLASVLDDFAANTKAYAAAQAFFAQTNPGEMAIGEAYTADLQAQLISGELSASELSAIEVVTTGSMKVSVNGSEKTLDIMDFHAATTIEGIAAVIQTELTSQSIAATCAVVTYPGGSKRIVIKTTLVGGTAALTYASSPATGTDVSALLNFTLATGATLCQGYTYVSLADELQSISNAASAQSKFLYGWCLARTFTSVSDQLSAAAWALSQTYAIMGLCYTNVNAYDAGVSTDLGSELKELSNKRVFAVWHDDTSVYPEMSILAYMLSVDYNQKDSTVTAKFKELPGIGTATVTYSQYLILLSKGYNVYTLMQSNVKVVREGETENTSWYLDTVINIDNFVNDLLVNVYNVFLRNAKVPYTRTGQALLVDVCRDTGNKYVYNGSFADRLVSDTSNKDGYSITPAVAITPTPIYQMSAANRAARTGPPIKLVVQEAGAIHNINISVNVVE